VPDLRSMILHEDGDSDATGRNYNALARW
jgi:hypothetical protein